MTTCNFKDRTLPEHKPKERSVMRIDDGFVLIGGWQLRYAPTPERRMLVLSKEYHDHLGKEAAVRQAKRRAEEEARQAARKRLH